jgi:hypothetical protein
MLFGKQPVAGLLILTGTSEPALLGYCRLHNTCRVLKNNLLRTQHVAGLHNFKGTCEPFVLGPELAMLKMPAPV